MGNHRFKGTTIGAIVAVVVLTAISVLGVYQIVRAYTAGYRALAEYSVQAQKPVFRVESVMLHNTSHVLITLVNDGPVGARVGRVHIFVYDPTTDVPSSTDEFPVNRYISVGGRVELYLHVDNLLRYIARDRPLRFAVETDKGPVLTSFTAFRGTVRVNVMYPTYAVNPDSQRITIKCPPQAGSPYFNYAIMSPSLLPPGFTLFHDPSSVISVSGEIPALAPCLVEYRATLRAVRMIKAQWDLNTETTTAKFLSTSFNVTYRALADIKPGSVAVVDINLPELITYYERVPPPPQLGAQVIDFSWYFFGYETDRPARSVLSTGESWKDTDYGIDPHPYTLTRTLLQSGAIEATSPLGCTIYPLASATPPSGLIDAWDWYEFTPSEWGRPYYEHAFHTGPTIVVPNPLSRSNCPATPTRGSTILRVSVPFELVPNRRYLIIPVFTYDDRDDNNQFRVALHVTVSDPGGAVRAVHTVNEPQLGGEPIGPVQVAVPFLVDASTAGVWRASIHVVYDEGSKVDWLRLVVSKVVIIPIVGSPMFCTFDATGEPVYPFADVHVTANTVTRNAVLMLRVEPRARDDLSPDQAQQVMDRLTFWRNLPYKDVTVRVDGQSGGRCTVRVGNTDITSMVRAPTFCAPGTSVVISYSDTGNNHGLATLIPYADVQGSPYTHDVADNVLRVGIPYNDPAFAIATDVEKPIVGVLVFRYSGGTQRLQLQVTAPSSSRWIVVIPFALYIQTNIPPPTPPQLTVDARVGQTPVSARVNYVYHTMNLMRGNVVVEFTGSQVSITVTLPNPGQDARMHFFIHAVTVSPSFSNMPAAEPMQTSAPTILTGIRVLNVTPSGSDPVYFRLIKKSDGEVLGIWRYAPQGMQSFNVLLPLNGLTSVGNDYLFLWIVERTSPDDYVLVIQNARC